MTLANMTQQETNEFNREHCKHIAHTLEYYANGQMWRCEDCGEVFNDYENGDEWDGETCPHCGETGDFEQLSIYDWLEDALEFKYTINGDMTYCAGRVMVAYGGPNIYVDTMQGAVQLFWWTDRAEYPLTRDAINALDEALEEFYEMCR